MLKFIEIHPGLYELTADVGMGDDVVVSSNYWLKADLALQPEMEVAVQAALTPEAVKAAEDEARATALYNWSGRGDPFAETEIQRLARRHVAWTAIQAFR